MDPVPCSSKATEGADAPSRPSDPLAPGRHCHGTLHVHHSQDITMLCSLRPRPRPLFPFRLCFQMSAASGIAISSNLSRDPDTLPAARPSSTYSRTYLFRRSYLPYPTWHSFTPSPVLSFRHNAPTGFPISCNGHARRVSSSPSCDRRLLKGAQDTPSLLANRQRDRCERSPQATQGRFGPNGVGRRESRRSGPTMAEAGIAGVRGALSQLSQPSCLTPLLR